MHSALGQQYEYEYIYLMHVQLQVVRGLLFAMGTREHADSQLQATLALTVRLRTIRVLLVSLFSALNVIAMPILVDSLPRVPSGGSVRSRGGRRRVLRAVCSTQVPVYSGQRQLIVIPAILSGFDYFLKTSYKPICVQSTPEMLYTLINPIQADVLVSNRVTIDIDTGNVPYLLVILLL